jgi:hypothetical protein
MVTRFIASYSAAQRRAKAHIKIVFYSFFGVENFAEKQINWRKIRQKISSGTLTGKDCRPVSICHTSQFPNRFAC